MITDADRRKLHGALTEVLGSDSSELLMELLPPTGWANLATQQDVTVLRADIDIAKTEVRIELQDLRTELKSDIHDLRTELQDVRTELKSDIQDVRTGLQSLSNELQDVPSEIKAQLPKLITANIASMIGVAGLVLGAVAIG